MLCVNHFFVWVEISIMLNYEKLMNRGALTGWLSKMLWHGQTLYYFWGSSPLKLSAVCWKAQWCLQNFMVDVYQGKQKPIGKKILLSWNWLTYLSFLRIPISPLSLFFFFFGPIHFHFWWNIGCCDTVDERRFRS